MTPMLGILASQISGHLSAGTAFDSISTTVVGAGGTSTVTFSSIPSTYKHLQIRCLGRSSSAGSGFDNLYLQINNDSGSNYAWHQLYGDGSSTGSGGALSTSVFSTIPLPQASISSNIFGTGIIDIFDYASTSKYKTHRSLCGADANGSGYTWIRSAVYMSTNAISSIKLTASGGNITQYSSFALYGIKG